MAVTSGAETGPGEYKPGPAACEPQVMSNRPTCATIKFGTGYKKSRGIKKKDLSEPAPGPGSYTLPGGVATKAKGALTGIVLPPQCRGETSLALRGKV